MTFVPIELFLNSIVFQFDVIVGTETRLTRHTDLMFSDDDYDILSIYRLRFGGEITVNFRKNITCKT